MEKLADEIQCFLIAVIILAQIFDIIKNKTLHGFYDCIWLDLQIDYFRVQVFGRTEIENCAGKKRKLLNLILVVVHLLLNGDHGASRMCQNYHLWFTSLSSWLRPAQSFRTRQFRYFRVSDTTHTHTCDKLIHREALLL